ncbi:MAG: tetratricopeptide repeat protein [Planctomycetota bacterium]
MKGRTARWSPLILWLLTAALFFPPALRGGYSFDDRATILENPLVQGELPAYEAFQRDYWYHRGPVGLYRPLVTLSLRAQVAAHGNLPWALHLGNLLLHLWVLGLLLACLPRGTALGLVHLPLIVFALWPFQAEVVTWIAGRSMALCAFLGTAAWILHARATSRGLRSALVFAGCLLPLLVREEGLAFAAAFWFASQDRGRDRTARVLVCVAVLAVVTARCTYLDPCVPKALAQDGATIVQRVLQGSQAWLLAASWIAWPLDLPLEVDARELARASLWRFGAGALVLAGAVLAWRSTRPAVPADPATRAWRRAALAGLFVALLPWMQIVPAPLAIAPRALYLPLLFLALGIAPTARRACTRIPAWLPLAWIATGCAVELRPLARAYGDELAYWEYRTATGPERREAWNGLGNERLRRGDAVGARRDFETAIELAPEYSRPYVGLAQCLLDQGDREGAWHAYQQALQRSPKNPVAHAGLGQLALSAGDSELALQHYRRATELQPGRAAFWRGLGRSLAAAGSSAEARAAWQQALDLDPGDETARRLLNGLDPP